MQKEGGKLLSSKDEQNAQKYLFIAILAVLVIVSYFIVKPYIIALISAFILAFLFLPVHRWLTTKLSKFVSAGIILLLVALIILAPLALIIGSIIQQADNFGNPEALSASLSQIRDAQLIQSIEPYIAPHFEKIAIWATNQLISLLGSAISYIPGLLVSFAITLFALFVILTEGDKLYSILENCLPVKNKLILSKHLSDSTNGIVKGILLIAILEAIVASIGFYLSGVTSYLLFPAIIFFLAFIPGIGPAFLWVPLALFYFLSSRFPEAIGVTITGLIISIGIDTLLSSKILSKRAKINPLVLLIGVLGGIPVFGVFGFIIGPLVLVYTLKILQEVAEN